MNPKTRILIVDDDPVVGKSFDRVLSGKGYAVIHACSGEEALRKLGSESYDAVFTDIRMPGMNGIEVAERIKAAKPWMPVVIVTGYGTEAYRARAAAAGVSDFLQKPLSPEMIAGSAAKAVNEAVAMTAAKVEAGTAAAVAAPAGRIKHIALFLAAPFIGLAFIVAAPLAGIGALGYFALKAQWKD